MITRVAEFEDYLRSGYKAGAHDSCDRVAPHAVRQQICLVNHGFRCNSTLQKYAEP